MGYLIRTDVQLPEEIRPKGKHFSVEEMQGYVGGYIQIVQIPGSRHLMVINEEGKILDPPLPCNVAASILAQQDIAGNVVITTFRELEGREPWEEEETR